MNIDEGTQLIDTSILHIANDHLAFNLPVIQSKTISHYALFELCLLVLGCPVHQVLGDRDDNSSVCLYVVCLHPVGRGLRPLMERDF